MRKILKWFVIGVAGLMAVLVAAVLVLTIRGNSKLNKQYAVEPAPVAISGDVAAIERGQYLASVSCVGCHGEDLAGTTIFSEPGLGVIPAPNLTAGAGGIGSVYSDADFVRAIRHGLDKEGKPLAIMPSRAYWHYTDEDLGAIVAYLKSVPAVDKDAGQREFGPAGKILIGAGVLDLFSAEAIDHDAGRVTVQTEGDGVVYGEYLVNISDCRQCHGADLSGGHSGEPGAPPGPNLASVSGWSEEQFLTVMRSGVTPGGQQLNPAYMPWPEFGRMTDDDLAAVYDYLQSNSTVVSEKE